MAKIERIVGWVNLVLSFLIMVISVMTMLVLAGYF